MKFPILDWSLNGILKKMERQNYIRTQMGMRTYISDHDLFQKYSPHEITGRVRTFFHTKKIVEEM